MTKLSKFTKFKKGEEGSEKKLLNAAEHVIARTTEWAKDTWELAWESC